MREIKFRAWDGNFMRYSDDGGGDYETEWYGTPWNFLSGAIQKLSEDGWNLMQYTGLEDKNRQEIYEGDILCGHLYGEDKTEVVEWDASYEGDSHPYSGFLVMLDSLFDDDLSNPDPRPIIDGEVIGNIYENPDLIKEDT